MCKMVTPDETGSCLMDKDGEHIILLHAHDHTEALFPEYYKILIQFMLEQGVEFLKPEFL